MKFLWLIILCSLIRGQDTSFITVESIGHTDSTYTNYSYQIINSRGDRFMADNVFRMTNFGSPAEIKKNMVFDGVTDFDTVSYREEFGKNSWSIVAKVNPARKLSDYLPLWTNKNGNVGYGVRFMSDNTLQVGIADGTDNTQLIYSVDSVIVGRENYIAVTYDGSYIRFYFEGELSNEVRYPLNNPYVPNTLQPFWIGSYGRETTTDWFEGTISELQVYTICLQESQLKTYPIPIPFYLGIGEENGSMYQIYYYVQEGRKHYIRNAYIIQCREFSQLKEMVEWIKIK